MAEEQALNLNPRSVIVPMMRSLHETIDITNIGLKALDAAELSDKVEVAGSKMRWVFHGVRPADEKKIAYENWLLSKGLQELARGVRDALEQHIFSARSLSISKSTATSQNGAMSATLSFGSEEMPTICGFLT